MANNKFNVGEEVFFDAEIRVDDEVCSHCGGDIEMYETFEAKGTITHVYEAFSRGQDGVKYIYDVEQVLKDDYHSELYGYDMFTTHKYTVGESVLRRESK